MASTPLRLGEAGPTQAAPPSPGAGQAGPAQAAQRTAGTGHAGASDQGGPAQGGNVYGGKPQAAGQAAGGAVYGSRGQENPGADVTQVVNAGGPSPEPGNATVNLRQESDATAVVPRVPAPPAGPALQPVVRDPAASRARDEAEKPRDPAAAGARDEAGKAGTGRKTRTKAVAGIVALLVVAAGLVGVVRPGPVKDWLASDEPTAAPTTAAPTAEASPTPVLAAANGGGTALTAAGVKKALDPLVGSAALGTKVHVRVLDVASEEVLYARNADTMTTPASTTKLLTAAAVLSARGPAYRIGTRAVAGSAPGEVVLVGGGDPTLSVGAKGQFPGAARLDQLAAQVKKALGGTEPTKVTIDTSLFSGPETAVGWDSSDISPGGQVSRIQSLMTNAGRIEPVHNEYGGDPRFPDPAVAAGKAFAKLLGVSGDTVKRGKAPTAATAASAPAGIAPGKQLGVVQSPPMVQLTDWMLEQSDNTMADVLGRHVAIADGQPATFDGATDAIVKRMTGLGLPGDEADLYDASGLSRNNGISPTLLTQLLALASSGQQPAISSMFGGLPVAGWSGTMLKRFVAPRANQIGQGVVRAKTGTLSGVNTMAGVVTTREGRLLVFAIMASGSGNAVTARAALDKVPARLVTCGC